MKRITISGVLFLSFIFNILYALVVVGVMLFQTEIKTYLGAEADVVAKFSVPVMYLIFIALSLLMQIVMIMSFSNSMRFTSPTLWVEICGCVLYGCVFRSLYHLLPAWEAKFARFGGNAALQSREMLGEVIQKFDWLFFMASACFLVGAGMTICFKKFIRYFIKG